MINKEGYLKAKFPGGVKVQALHLKGEGHTILSAKGKKPPRVKDFEKSLVTL